MTLGADPMLARDVASRLDALCAALVVAEDDVLACLVVTGEPRPQRVLDDWIDQVADTLRALGESAADLTPAVDRWTATGHPQGAHGDSTSNSTQRVRAGTGRDGPSGTGADAGAET